MSKLHTSFLTLLLFVPLFMLAGSDNDTIINSRQEAPPVLKEEIFLPNFCISADITNFFVSNGYVNVDLCITRKIAASLVFSNKISGGINVHDGKKKTTVITDRQRMYAIGIKYFHDFYAREDRSPFYLQTMLNMGTSHDYAVSKDIFQFFGGSIGLGYCSLSDSGIYTNTDIGLGYFTLGKNFYPKLGFEVGYAF